MKFKFITQANYPDLLTFVLTENVKVEFDADYGYGRLLIYVDDKKVMEVQQSEPSNFLVTTELKEERAITDSATKIPGY